MFFKYSVFSNRTPYPLPKSQADSSRFKRDLNRCSGKTEVRSLIWAPHCSYRAEASQRIMWEMLFQHKCNCFTNCKLASFSWARGARCPWLSTVVFRAARGRGIRSNSCPQAPELLGRAFVHVSSLFLRSCALIWARTTQRHCPQTLGLLFLDWPLFTHSSAGGVWNIPLWFCGSGAASWDLSWINIVSFGTGMILGSPGQARFKED